jgi:D-sedoheptulose 7-phosphate isomerase
MKLDVLTFISIIQVVILCVIGLIKNKEEFQSMQLIRDLISKSIEVKQQLLANEQLLEQVQQAIEVIATAFKNGNKVLFCGNGGSAADAQHLAAEFSGRFYKDRPSLPAEALHCNTSYLTAVANDYSYEVIYARLIEGMGLKGDVLVGFSTSGNSANIVKAFEAAKSKGVLTIGFTGATGGVMKEQSDVLLNVPSYDTPRIQESHILLGHIICQVVEENVFPS